LDAFLNLEKQNRQKQIEMRERKRKEGKKAGKKKGGKRMKKRTLSKHVSIRMHRCERRLQATSSNVQPS
jgi:hypothetical protein